MTTTANHDAPPPQTRPEDRPESAWSPLGHQLFRSLWIASLASNIGTWMQNVGAAWLMTDLSASPLMVALVQAATNLPFFVLAIPAGALADIVDRRRLLLVAQSWMLIVAAALAVVTFTGQMTPALLLTLTFLLGLGAALNAPAWQATTPDLVPRAEIPAAVALGGISLNGARAVGPALGGLLVAAAGPGATFLFNAVSFLGVLFVLARWRRPHETSALPAERFVGAMRVGLRYVRNAPSFQAVLIRTLAFVVGGSSLLALLPLLIKQDASLGPAHYGILLGCFGIGAVIAVALLPSLVRRLGVDRTVSIAFLALAVPTLAVALLPNFLIRCVLVLLAGAAWLAALTRLNATAQAAVPRWVRARALAVYLLVFYGGMAAGSILWGFVADQVGVAAALTASAAWMVVGLLATIGCRLPEGEGAELEPSRHWPEMAAPCLERERGPVMVTVEYRIDPAQLPEFLAAIGPLRAARLRDGAFRWDLFQDAADPARLVEVFLVESWVEHLRQHERVTEADRILQEHLLAWHQAATPPLVTHLVAGLHAAAKDRQP
jgi:MFS family permease